MPEWLPCTAKTIKKERKMTTYESFNHHGWKKGCSERGNGTELEIVSWNCFRVSYLYLSS